MHQPIPSSACILRVSVSRGSKAKQFGNRHLINQKLTFLQLGFGDAVTGLDDGRRGGGFCCLDTSGALKETPDRTALVVSSAPWSMTFRQSSGRGRQLSPGRRQSCIHKASASRGWQTVPDSPGWPQPSAARVGSSVSSARRDRQNCMCRQSRLHLS